MLNLKIEAAKSLFFDRLAVMEALTKAEQIGLSRAGAFTRRAAQTLMRSGGKKGKISKPGEPPRTHGDRLLRKHLFFAFEPSKKSVVVGPALLNGRAKYNRGKTIPETLEFGGAIDVPVSIMRDGTAVPTHLVKPAARRFLHRTIRPGFVEARPYMRPAREKVEAKFAEMFRNTFRSGGPA